MYCFVFFLLIIFLLQSFLGYEPTWFRLLYPHFLHPLRGFVQTSAIYMVVAVSAERFRAICHPLAPRQPYYKFVVVAVICSATLEIPK